MSSPLVTVLMSVHNGGQWVGAAVRSILAQSFRDFEFLIIDDASTDDTAAAVQAFDDPRIRLVRLEENIGLTRALNLGLRQARGQFIARQDADDVSMPERIALQTAFLHARPEVVIVGSQGWLCNAHGAVTGTRLLATNTAGIRWAGLFFNPFIHSAVMFRTEVIREQLGGYDETFALCQDYELWLRAANQFAVANLEENLVSVLEHTDSVSATRPSAAGEAVERIVNTLVAQLFPGRTFAPEIIAAICNFRRGPEPEDPAGFREAYRQFTRAYLLQYPEAAGDPAFERARAVVERDCGYRALSQDRAVGLQFLVCALRRWPRLIGTIPWPRTLALLILGRHARGFYQRLTLG